MYKLYIQLILFIFISCFLYAENPIRSGDRFKVEVFNHEELSGDFVVNDDGYLYMPLIDTIYVKGLNFSTAREIILKKYSEYLKSPNIIIMPIFRISILGEVNTPGIYNISGVESVSEIVAMAGGLTDKANPASAKLLRRGKVIAKFNIYKATTDELARKNVTILPQDVIIISRRFMPTLQEWSVIVSSALSLATLLTLIISLNR